MAEIDTLDTGRFITQLSSFRREICGCVTPLGRSMDDESVESQDRGLMEGRGVRSKERRKEGRKEGRKE